MDTSFFKERLVPNQLIKKDHDVSLFLKREDLLHPEISGNKFRKLKYNIKEAVLQGKESILTFGGAFSNHIAATAAAGEISCLRTIGVIRGEELGENLEKTLKENPTLNFAVSRGMELEFISRSDYRKKTSDEILQRLKHKYGDFYLIPEGGTNPLAVKGCEEIMTKGDLDFDFICCPVGTGGTMAGIINSSAKNQLVLGFPALKGDFLSSEISGMTHKNNWRLMDNYHFGGYAKLPRELVHFINKFKREFGVALDPIYTGKMMYGILDLIEKGYFLKNTRILAVHTGGLQGISGMNRLLKNKGLPPINV